MKPWISRCALLATCVIALALTGCGGGGVEADTAQPMVVAEPLPVSYELRTTDRLLDLGVYGEGLFVMEAVPGGARSYSRFGRLDVGAGGQLIHADGARVLGVSDDPALDAAPLPALALAMPARATQRVAQRMNLDARRPTHDEADAFDPEDASTYDSATSITVWSEDGRSHAFTLYFRHQAPASPNPGEGPYWLVRAKIDGRLTATPHALHFDANGSRLPESERLYVLPAGDAGWAQALEVDFSGTTGYGAGFEVTEMGADGYAPGALTAVTVQADGRLTLQYDNGQSALGGQLLLARFTVADRLQRSSQSSWTCGSACNAPTLGTPGSARLGTIRAGALNSVY